MLNNNRHSFLWWNTENIQNNIHEFILCDITLNQVVTNVGEVVQSICSWSMVHHFSTNQQGQSVKQSVDGVARLVNGHNYGSSTADHSENKVKCV